ncbi:hypothetical protein GCM10009609_15140 [Pseudonocardia aurantiaca]|uniref:HEXXH motif-containing putative peptide modification protein n=1 Tax=Pseudonocardia aurantiaca TaxID=75290 RepID=A0ABW4FWX0_9PSEU
MRVTPEELSKAHAQLGDPEEILHQRRTLYAAAVSLCTGTEVQVDVEQDTLDNPAVRGHLGAVLSGRSRYTASARQQLTDLVAPGFGTEVGGWPVRLASAPVAPSALAGALQRIAGELTRHGDESGGLALLTVEQGGAIDEAWDRLVDGVLLAVRVAPELAMDLLPHVSLFAVVVTEESARLGSASAREYPGLILIPKPRSALEVAEALFHEGAHQKFFDFGMTRAMLGPLSPQAPRFAPPWAPPGAPEWPLEQSVAAWHAYHCLAAFYGCLHGVPDELPLDDGSLLPKAASRAAEIGRYLRRQGSFLGQDAHALIAALEGAPPDDPSPVDEAAAEVSGAVDDGSILVYPAGRRTLVVKRGAPPVLYWVDPRLGSRPR